MNGEPTSAAITELLIVLCVIALAWKLFSKPLRHVIPGLNALRSAAILLVLIFHFHIAAISGPMGVMIFFVLSGYLITTGLATEYRASGTISIKRFYARRAFRIFPAFYVCWIITTIFDAYHGNLVPRQAVASFVYLTNYVRGLAPAGAGQNVHMWIAWSLAVEEQFYLVWPLLLRWLLSLRRPLGALSLIILSLWIMRFLAMSFGIADAIYAYHAFEMRADALFVGSFIALSEPIWSKSTSWLTSSVWYLFITGTTLTLMAVFELSVYPTITMWQFALWITVQPVIIGVFMIQLIHWGKCVPALLDNTAIASIASLSYGLYLYHPLSGQISAIIPHLARFKAIENGVILAGTVLVSYYLIELPMLRLRDSLHGSRRRREHVYNI